MIVFMKSPIGLTEGVRRELRQRAASRSGGADDGRRTRLILLLAAGHRWAQMRDKLSCNDAFIALEQAVWAGATGGAVESPCRAWRAQTDPAIGGADSGLDGKAQAGRRIDALEHAQAGFGIVDLAHDGGAGMGKAPILRATRAVSGR